MSDRKVVQCVVTGVDAEGHSVIESVRVMATDAEQTLGLHKEAAMCYARSQGGRGMVLARAL